MKTLFLLLFFLSAGAHAQDDLSWMNGPPPMRFRCIDLDGFAIGKPDSDVQLGVKANDWSPAMASFARRAADECGEGLRRVLASRGRLDGDAERSIAQFKKSVIRRATQIESENTAARQQQVDQYAQQARGNEDASAATRQSADQACKSTVAHQLYVEQESVIDHVDSLKMWQAKQAQEARIARTSGVRNLLNERNNGEWIVRTSDELKESFDEYKRLGGKATSPAKVRHQVVDPCEQHAAT